MFDDDVNCYAPCLVLPSVRVGNGTAPTGGDAVLQLVLRHGAGAGLPLPGGAAALQPLHPLGAERYGPRGLGQAADGCQSPTFGPSRPIGPSWMGTFFDVCALPGKLCIIVFFFNIYL